MSKLYLFLFFVGISTVILSCKKDLEAEIPSYVTINSISVEDSTGKLVSSNITDSWVYINDKFKGVFELPVTFPVIENGSHRIDIRPGINENGITETKVNYAFYQAYSTHIDLKDEEVYVLDAVVRYKEAAQINTSWAGANFEGGINFFPSPDSDTTFQLTAAEPANSVYGKSSGSFYLTDEKDFFEAYSADIVSIPRNGTEVWIEMDYKSDVTLAVGLYQDFRQVQYPLVYFKPQNNWTKVYINLNNAILSKPAAPNYNFFIAALKDNDQLEITETTIDNVKLLHF